jgi:hypothetical protein
MTATANDVITKFLSSETYEVTAERVDAIAVVLLIVLLVEQELLRVYAGGVAGARPRSFDVAVVPLLLAFALVVIVRSFDLR